MEEPNTDFCELTNEELGYVLGGNGTVVGFQHELMVKKAQVREAQAQFEK